MLSRNTRVTTPVLPGFTLSLASLFVWKLTEGVGHLGRSAAERLA